MDIQKDQLENFLIEDISEGFILGANPMNKRISYLDNLLVIDNETNLEILKSIPGVLIPTNLMIPDEQLMLETSIGYRYRLKGEFNEDIIIIRIPKGTSHLTYELDREYVAPIIKWDIKSLKGLTEVITEIKSEEGVIQGYELIQDVYCLITNSDENILLDNCIPSGNTHLITETLDTESKDYIPTYFAAISKLDNPLEFSNAVINLLNKNVWVPVTQKSYSKDSIVELTLQEGHIYKSRGCKFKCLSTGDNPGKSDIANFENDSRFIQL